MERKRTTRAAISLVVIVCFLTAGCAAGVGQPGLTQPGQAALACGAGGAALGAAIGAGASRDWTGALIGAAAGALVGATTCFAIAEYRSRQVTGYQETQQTVGYQPSQGDAIQITNYELTPAAVAPGGEVAFNATYYVMTPNPDQDVPITEIRILRVYDPQTNQYRELGRAPSQVTVKPGTRQSDGKIPVGSGVAEGRYQLAFQVVKNGVSDSKVLPLTVTTNRGILEAPTSRVAQVGAPGAKRLEPAAARPAAAPMRPSEPAPPAAAPPARDVPLSALGEPQPKAPAPPIAAASPATPSGPIQPPALNLLGVWTGTAQCPQQANRPFTITITDQSGNWVSGALADKSPLRGTRQGDRVTLETPWGQRWLAQITPFGAGLKMEGGTLVGAEPTGCRFELSKP